MSKIYKVINVIDEYTIIVNYGYNDGSREEDKIRIFEEGEEVFDLDNKSLGNIDIIKEELEVITVYPRFSICKKIRTYTSNPFTAMSLTSKKISEFQLKINKEEASHLRYKSNMAIKKGDLVKIIK